MTETGGLKPPVSARAFTAQPRLAQGVPAGERHTPDFAKRVGPEGSTPGNASLRRDPPRETRRFGGIHPGKRVGSEESIAG